MKQITRETFTAAIEAGIAMTDLEPQEEERLLLVAATAKTAETNYGDPHALTGCPATMAGLDPIRAEVRRFAYGYDDYMSQNVFAAMWGRFEPLEIV